MRASLISATLVAAMFSGSFALADVATGRIQAIDAATKTVTLTDGTAYTTTKDMLGGYLPGDSITIMWDGESHHAVAISSNFLADSAGKIVAVDHSGKTVTLDNGKVYTFPSGTDLAGYKVGDMATIVADSSGSTNAGRSISPHFSDETTGVVRAISAANNTITLADGKVFKFDSGADVGLSGFRVGDMVKINATLDGNIYRGHGISAANS